MIIYKDNGTQSYNHSLLNNVIKITSPEKNTTAKLVLSNNRLNKNNIQFLQSLGLKLVVSN